MNSERLSGTSLEKTRDWRKFFKLKLGVKKGKLSKGLLTQKFSRKPYYTFIKMGKPGYIRIT